MNRWIKAIIITAGVILGLWLLIMFVVSPIGKVVVEKKSPDFIGRNVEIGTLRVDPFLGAVTIKDFSLKEVNGDSVFVEFDKLYVRLSLPKLLFKKVQLRHIWLNGFSVNVEQKDSVFNFTDIIERFKKDEDEENDIKDTVPSSWKVLLDDIRLHGGKIGYCDISNDRAWKIENINLDIPGLHFDNHQTDAGLSLDLPDNGGNLNLKGSYNVAHGVYSLFVDMTDIDLNQALPLVQDYLNIKQLDALVSGNLKANGRFDDMSSLRLEGVVEVDGVDIRDEDRQTVLAAEHIGVKIESVNPMAMVVKLDSIIIDSVSVNFVRDKNYDTFSRLIKSNSNNKQKANENLDESEDLMTQAEELENDSSVVEIKNKKPLPDIRINYLLLKNSVVHYVDRTLPSKFKYDISKISVRANNVNLRGKQNHIMIGANLPNGGSVMANWKGGIDLENDNVKLVAMVRNMQLKDLSPFMEYMFAYPIKSGSLSVTSDNTFVYGRLDGTTKLDILNMELGKKTRNDAQLKRVPLKTAIEMLTDFNGKISLTLPMAGNINNPKFSLRKIVMGTIGNVLLKATATPFAAMARSKGFSTDDLEQLGVDLLTPDFNLEQYAKMDVIAEMMKEKQDLQLYMQQSFNLEDAMQQLAVFNLKRDYFLTQHPSIDGSKRLSLVEIEKVKAIKDADKGFEGYYKPLCKKKGKLYEKALDYYGADSVKNEILRHAEIRNKILTRYMVEQKGIDKQRVEIRTAADASLVVYKGKPKYDIKALVKQ